MQRASDLATRRGMVFCNLLRHQEDWLSLQERGFDELSVSEDCMVLVLGWSHWSFRVQVPRATVRYVVPGSPVHTKSPRTPRAKSKRCFLDVFSMFFRCFLIHFRRFLMVFLCNSKNGILHGLWQIPGTSRKRRQKNPHASASLSVVVVEWRFVRWCDIDLLQHCRPAPLARVRHFAVLN